MSGEPARTLVCRRNTVLTLISCARPSGLFFRASVQRAAPCAVSNNEVLDEALREVIQSGTPVLGICLGMQVSLTHSEENDTPTLNVIPGQVRRFAFDRKDLKIPHMGWNEVRVLQAHPVLAGIERSDEFLFCAQLFSPTSVTMQCLLLLIMKTNSPVRWVKTITSVLSSTRKRVRK